jgi:uncharacterized repeat protein (TIGR03803 family)
MNTVDRLPVRKLGLLRVPCIVLVFCALAIALPGQTFTSLASFSGTNGAQPVSSLVQGTDSSFYGATQYGGSNCTAYNGPGCGTVFKVTSSGTLTAIYSFCSQNFCPDGSSPLAGLVLSTDGNFYGTTSSGGGPNGGYGTVFKITPNGTLTTLHSFEDALDGSTPSAPLVQGTDGSLYGTTMQGGPGNNGGTIFKIAPGGTFTTLYTFCNPNYGCPGGIGPAAGLVQGTDGNFYGTTEFGHPTTSCQDGCGTVFKITPCGILTYLYTFCTLSDCADGSEPAGALVQGTDGNFYGTTSGGGTNSDGTVFKITPNGTLTTLHSFSANDGRFPYGGLVQATDANFYGTTSSGGTNGAGTIFKITADGALTSLYSFCAQQSCADGGFPVAALLQASNGMFHGTTYYGGTGTNCYEGGEGCGTVFSLTGPTPTAVQFVPVAPCRLLDTRQTHDPIQGGTFQFFDIPQLGDCNIPTTAAAYSLNVTVVPQRPLGYLTIWPAGLAQPNISTMNSLDGRIKANAAIVAAGASGAVSVFASNTTDLVLDIDGYFEPASGRTLQFYALKPCRVLDTRDMNGDLGGPYLPAGQERSFPVLSSDCQIPSNAQAYSMNFTVVPYQGQALGYLTVWAQGSPKPVVSTLNNLTATIVANAAIVPAGTGGGIAVYPAGNTQLVADIDGYFAPPGEGGLSLYPAPPCRVIDTRKGNGALSGELTVDVVDSVCAPPATAQVYVFNATIVPVGSLSYLTLWPDTEDKPAVSTLNAIDGAITSNMAIVPNIDGKTDAFAAGTTQLILDISSYFAP